MQAHSHECSARRGARLENPVFFVVKLVGEADPPERISKSSVRDREPVEVGQSLSPASLPGLGHGGDPKTGPCDLEQRIAEAPHRKTCAGSKEISAEVVKKGRTGRPFTRSIRVSRTIAMGCEFARNGVNRRGRLQGKDRRGFVDRPGEMEIRMADLATTALGGRRRVQGDRGRRHGAAYPHEKASGDPGLFGCVQFGAARQVSDGEVHFVSP